MSEHASRLSKLIWIATLAPLTFFIIRAVQYALIGSFAPLWLAVISGALVIAALTSGETMSQRALRLFGIVLVLYGLIRVLLGILLKIAPVDSAHASEATSVVYFIISALFLYGGIYLFKNTAALKR